MAESLSPARQKQARNSFFAFNILNSFSFVLLSGSFITLYALKLGASASFVGLLNALGYVTFFFLPVGKGLVKRKAIISIFGGAWLLRSVSMLPVLAAPFLAAAGHQGAAFGCIIAGVATFNVFRGIGLIGNNPVLAFLSEGRDKGAYLITIQIISSLTGMATSLLAALLLGRSAGMGYYVFLIGIGVLVGVIGALFLFKLPEPLSYRPTESGGLVFTARQAFREAPYRSFITVFILLSFAVGMARAFLPVYAKEVYGQSDDFVMAFSLLASLGSVAVGLLMRLLVDRLGAKPLLVIFTAVSALSLVPAVISPSFASPAAAIVFLGLLHMFNAFGMSGEENAGQTYHFALVPRERTLDLAVVYFVAYGLGGSLGSAAGGFLLDFLGPIAGSSAGAFRIFFGILFSLFVVALFMAARLVRLGSVSVRESLGVMLSIRDLRAFDLLSRLDRSESPAEELRLIHEIGESGSPRSRTELLGYLSSPRFEVRMEALLALENLEGIEAETVKALVRELEHQPWTTAYLAARILGKKAVREALPAIRVAMEAEDYMLRGAAVVAAARLGDRESIPRIEEILYGAENPRVRLSAAYALELLASRDSVPALVGCLRREDPPAYVSDELLLAIVDILGLLERFYPMYSAFIEDEARGRSLLADLAGDRADIMAAADSILAEPPDGALTARLILGIGREGAVEMVLSEAALDPELGYRGFRYFLAVYPALQS